MCQSTVFPVMPALATLGADCCVALPLYLIGRRTAKSIEALAADRLHSAGKGNDDYF